MTAEELRAARIEIGLSAVDFARLLDVTDRAVRTWERGEADSNATAIPRYVEIIVRLMLERSAVRRELISCYLGAWALTSGHADQRRPADRRRVASQGARRHHAADQTS